MSYVKLNPSYYQMLQPESAWHPGAEGWSVAPYPGWGENPALVGPKRLGIEGLGDDATVAAAAPECNHVSSLLAGISIGALIIGVYAALTDR